jgi:hypothetical protein
MATATLIAKSLKSSRRGYNDSDLSSTSWPTGPRGRAVSNTTFNESFHAWRTPSVHIIPPSMSTRHSSIVSPSNHQSAPRAPNIHHELRAAADQLKQRQDRQADDRIRFGKGASLQASPKSFQSTGPAVHAPRPSELPYRDDDSISLHSDIEDHQSALGSSRASRTPSHLGSSWSSPPTNPSLQTARNVRLYQRRRAPEPVSGTQNNRGFHFTRRVGSPQGRSKTGRALDAAVPIAIAAGVGNIVSSSMGAIERKVYEDKKEKQMKSMIQTSKEVAQKKLDYVNQHGIPLGIPPALAPKTHQASGGSLYKSKTAADPHSWAFGGTQQQQFYGTGDLF